MPLAITIVAAGKVWKALTMLATVVNRCAVKANQTRTRKHGVEVRYGNGRRLQMLSYAVWVNGVCQVDHSTTNSLRLEGRDIFHYAKLESQRGGLPVI